MQCLLSELGGEGYETSVRGERWGLVTPPAPPSHTSEPGAMQMGGFCELPGAGARCWGGAQGSVGTAWERVQGDSARSSSSKLSAPRGYSLGQCCSNTLPRSLGVRRGEVG